MVQFKIPKENIIPHRTFAKKTCYGNKLTDEWARNLVSETTTNWEQKCKTLEAKIKAIKDIVNL